MQHGDLWNTVAGDLWRGGGVIFDGVQGEKVGWRGGSSRGIRRGLGFGCRWLGGRSVRRLGGAGGGVEVGVGFGGESDCMICLGVWVRAFR